MLNCSRHFILFLALCLHGSIKSLDLKSKVNIHFEKMKRKGIYHIHAMNRKVEVFIYILIQEIQLLFCVGKKERLKCVLTTQVVLFRVLISPIVAH
jgi:hypothetical protein